MELCIIVLYFLMVSVSSKEEAQNTFLGHLKDQEERLIEPEKSVFQNTCCPHIGCFYNGPPFFDPRHRPFIPPPECAENMTFPLYTSTNPEKSYNLTYNKASIRKSPFKCGLETKIIIHGYTPDYQSFIDMKDAFLRQGDYNILVPDYQMYAQSPFARAASNTRAVGARVAKLMKIIMSTCNINGSSFHIIGHSYGAQVAGYAGKRVKNLARITGLDPASPFFQYVNSSEVFLNKEDAIFVDIIHTSGEYFSTLVALGLRFPGIGFGFLLPIGDIDFYPNNGSHQPGCDSIKRDITAVVTANVTGIIELVSCSHTRSVQYFTESINSDCKFKAVECSNYTEFLQGNCPPQNSRVNQMGLYAKKIEDISQNSNFYLRTKATSPYCLEDGDKSDNSAALSKIIGS